MNRYKGTNKEESASQIIKSGKLIIVDGNTMDSSIVEWKEEYCESILEIINNGESLKILLQDIFPSSCPLVDSYVISKFVEFFDPFCAHFVDCLNFFSSGPKDNALNLVYHGIFDKLNDNMPEMLYMVYTVLNQCEEDLSMYFIRSGGLYYMILYSFQSKYHKIISDLAVKIARCDIMYADIEYSPKLSIFGENNEPIAENSFIDLFNNIMLSNDEESVRVFLIALQQMFEKKIQACVILGPLLMELIPSLIENVYYKCEAIKAISKSIRGLPMMFRQKLYLLVISIIDSIDDEEIMRFVLEVLENLFDEHESNAFIKAEDIIHVLSHVLNNMTYNTKIYALDVLISIIKSSCSEEIRNLISGGIIQVLCDFTIITSSSKTLQNVLQCLSILIGRIVSIEISIEDQEKVQSIIPTLEELIECPDKFIADQAINLLNVIVPLLSVMDSRNAYD